MGLVARHTHVFQELGITRGQYTGLLPLLVRHGVADLFTMPDRNSPTAAAAAATAGAGDGGVAETKGAAGGGKRGSLRERGQQQAGPSSDGGWAEVRQKGWFVVFHVPIYACVSVAFHCMCYMRVLGHTPLGVVCTCACETVATYYARSLG